MMEQCQPANQDTPSNVWDTMLSVLPFGTWSAETIRASSRVRCANRPDTRLHLTDAHISSKNVLLCRSHPHKIFFANAKGMDLQFTFSRQKLPSADYSPMISLCRICAFPVHFIGVVGSCDVLGAVAMLSPAHDHAVTKLVEDDGEDQQHAQQNHLHVRTYLRQVHTVLDEYNEEGAENDILDPSNATS